MSVLLILFMLKETENVQVTGSSHNSVIIFQEEIEAMLAHSGQILQLSCYSTCVPKHPTILD